MALVARVSVRANLNLCDAAAIERQAYLASPAVRQERGPRVKCGHPLFPFSKLPSFFSMEAPKFPLVT